MDIKKELLGILDDPLLDGARPFTKAITADDSDAEIEEERRLCYVGMTRAKENLYLSAARRRMQNGKYNDYLVSRFVDEIEDGLIVKNVLAPSLRFDDDYADNDFWGYNKRGGFAKKRFDNYISENNYSKSNSSMSVSKIDLKKSIDSYRTGKNIVKATSLDYKVGDKVSHIKFGDGVVKNIEDVGRDYEVTVDFEEVGTKTLFAAFAKLEKI